MPNLPDRSSGAATAGLSPRHVRFYLTRSPSCSLLPVVTHSFTPAEPTLGLGPSLGQRLALALEEFFEHLFRQLAPNLFLARLLMRLIRPELHRLGEALDALAAKVRAAQAAAEPAGSPPFLPPLSKPTLKAGRGTSCAASRHPAAPLGWAASAASAASAAPVAAIVALVPRQHGWPPPPISRPGPGGDLAETGENFLSPASWPGLRTPNSLRYHN